MYLITTPLTITIALISPLEPLITISQVIILNRTELLLLFDPNIIFFDVQNPLWFNLVILNLTLLQILELSSLIYHFKLRD